MLNRDESLMVAGASRDITGPGEKFTIDIFEYVLSLDAAFLFENHNFL